MHIVTCVSSSSIRLRREERTDLARVSIPPPFFLRRRDFPPLGLVGGGESKSPMIPNGLPPPFPLLLPLRSELKREEEKSPDPPNALPDDGMNGLLLFPPDPKSPSKNGFDEGSGSAAA